MLTVYKHAQARYLSKEHNEVCQLLVRFVRLQFEDLHIGLVVSVLLLELVKVQGRPLVTHYRSVLTDSMFTNQPPNNVSMFS